MQIACEELTRAPETSVGKGSVEVEVQTVGLEYSGVELLQCLRSFKVFAQVKGPNAGEHLVNLNN